MTVKKFDCVVWFVNGEKLVIKDCDDYRHEPEGRRFVIVKDKKRIFLTESGVLMIGYGEMFEDEED